MIRSCEPKRCMGRTEFLTGMITERALVGTAILTESEMALFYECVE